MSCLLKAKTNKEYPLIDHGQGVYLFDTAGRDYIDGSSGAIVANIGHAIPEIAEVAREQISQVAYTYRMQFNNEKAEELAEKIVRRARDKAAAFFLSSGSEAAEAALRLIIQYWRERQEPLKRRILSRQVSYHGNTLGALSLSSDARRSSMEGLLVTEPVVSPCYCYRCPFNESPETCQLACADDLEKAILRIGPEHVAAFVTEPIVGATGGAIVPHEGYFARVREICDRYDVLLVVDEVITGFGRTGAWFAMHHWDVAADLTILGKGLNAGYTPLSAILVSAELRGAIAAGSGQLSIGHTHSCNPLSAAICCEVIDYIERHDLVSAAARKGHVLGKVLRNFMRRYDFIGDVRGFGLLWGLEFVQDRTSRLPFVSDKHVTDAIVDLAFENGLIVYPCRGLMHANKGDAVLVAPPLTISADEMDALADRLERTLNAFSKKL